MQLFDMFLEILGVSFFLGCSALILHLIFFSLGSDLRRETLFMSLGYSLARFQVDAFYLFADKSFFELPFDAELGGMVGALAGYYLGFATCVFSGFGNKEEQKVEEQKVEEQKVEEQKVEEQKVPIFLYGLSAAIGASISEVGRFLAPYLPSLQHMLSELL